MFGRRKRQSSDVDNPTISGDGPSNHNGVPASGQVTSKKQPLSKRLFSFSSGSSDISDPESLNQRSRRHTYSTGKAPNTQSFQPENISGHVSSPLGKYAFDFPSPENVGHVRRMRSNSISGASPNVGPKSSVSNTVRTYKTTPNLSEKDLMKVMPPLIRCIYENKSDQFQQELRASLKFTGKKQIPEVFEIVDKHHRRNIFHWIALLNRQNIAKSAVDVINNRQIVDYLLSAVDKDGRTPLHLVRKCCKFFLLTQPP